jgi:cyclase
MKTVKTVVRSGKPSVKAIVKRLALAANVVFPGGICAAILVCVAGTAGVAFAQEIAVFQVRPNFFMISGAGANIGVQVGPDGAVVVDSGTEETSAAVLAEIRKLSDLPIRYLINTSADADSVGGNATLARSGQSIFSGVSGPRSEFVKAMTGGLASILAHENVLTRMSAPTGKASPFPSDAWPSEAFATNRRYLYLNHEGIEALHQPAAHSDGDCFVFFRSSDVVMAGNILDTTRLPVIDVEKGGGIQGEIDALNKLIELAIPSIPFIFLEGGTLVIPGHGRIYDQADIVEYRDMIVILRDVIQDMMKRGMTLAQIQSANPVLPYEKQYGAKSGPWTTNDFVEAVYKSLAAKK